MRRLLALVCVLSLAACLPTSAADKEMPKDTAKAADTRKALDAKISVEWKDDLIQDVGREFTKKIKEATKADVKVVIDSKVSGLTQNKKVTYKASDKPIKEILDEFCKANELGYIVISGTYSAGKKPPAYPAKDFDGVLLFTKGDERGYPSDK